MPLIVPLLPPPDLQARLEEQSRSHGHRRTLDYFEEDLSILFREDEELLLCLITVLLKNSKDYKNFIESVV